MASGLQSLQALEPAPGPGCGYQSGTIRTERERGGDGSWLHLASGVQPQHRSGKGRLGAPGQLRGAGMSGRQWQRSQSSWQVGSEGKAGSFELLRLRLQVRPP